MTKHVPTAKKRAMDKRGSVPMFVCALIPAVVFMGVFTVRAANNWVVQARLQSALDAGALAAARDIKRLENGTAAEKQAALDRIKALIAGIYNDSSGNSTTLSASNVSVSVNGDKVDVGGSVNAANPATGGTTTITRNSSAVRSNTGVELALVFDTTLSMAQKSSVTNLQHIEAARDAAKEMLRILYGDKPNTTRKEWLEGTYFSIVPYNIAVNIGTSNEHMLESGSAPAYSNGFSWSGCVEARRDNHHLTDDGPMTVGFKKYYWPSTYEATRTVAAGKCGANQDYTQSTKTSPNANQVCMGHNDWAVPSSVQSTVASQNNFIAHANKYVQVELGISGKTLSFGPNMMCPTQPITPLTMDRKTIEDRLDLLPNLPFAFGTIIPTGLQGAWYTLSPKWRSGTASGGNGWTSVEPVKNDGRPAIPRGMLPQDYTRDTKKVIVLLSDGDNNWPNARNITQAVYAGSGGWDTTSSYTSGSNSMVVWPENTRTELFYSAYGLLSTETRLGISKPAFSSLNSSQLNTDYSTVRSSSAGADAKLNTATSTLCTNIKNAGIIIYTIGFGIGPDKDSRGRTTDAATHRSLMRNCATSTEHFLEAPTPEDLTAAFSKIAQQLSSLRLNQ